LYRQLSTLHQHSEIAAVNFDSHFVVSAAEESMGEIESVLVRENITYQKIAVSYPFHSRWIEGAKEAAMAVLGTILFRPPTIPLTCCAKAGALGVLTPEAIWSTVRQPIAFEETIGELEKSGPHHYVDVGPAGTLATFLKYALPSTSKSKSYAVLSPFGTEVKNYERLTSELASFGKSFPSA
jgi:acyl transferase domain-containing protein